MPPHDTCARRPGGQRFTHTEHADRGIEQVITLVRHPARQDITQTETIMKFHASIAAIGTAAGQTVIGVNRQGKQPVQAAGRIRGAVAFSPRSPERAQP